MLMLFTNSRHKPRLFPTRPDGGWPGELRPCRLGIENLDRVGRSIDASGGGTRHTREGQFSVFTWTALSKVTHDASPNVLGCVNHHAILSLALGTNRARNEARAAIGFGHGIRHTLDTSR
jgi:hypothetical protein